MTEHPLQNPWSLYITELETSKDRDHYVCIKLAEAKTVESFFQIYKTIQEHAPVEQIKSGGFSLFKDNIQPMTEDSNNVYRYRLQEYPINKDSYLKLFLLPISGQFPNINGIYTKKKEIKKLTDFNTWNVEIWSKEEVDIESIKNALDYSGKCAFLTNRS